ncbi:MAG: DUF58 domain-containing protein [Actinomycetota bacterium]|nr:DUF58 domain-containing protein [Actinomycetota bacterium]
MPTGRLALAVGVAAGVTLAIPLAAPWGLVATIGMVAIAALIDLVVGLHPGRVEVERHLPAVVSLGGTAEVSWSLRQPLPRPVRVGFSDELAPSLRPGVRRARVSLSPGTTHRVRTTLNPSRRGRFLPAELVVRTDGPLGLMSRQAARSVPQELRVYPGFGARQQAELLARTRIAEIGSRRARLGGSGTDFDQLRDYGVDDDARRIDWAATARMARPIVRTYRVERNQTLIVLFDNGRTMAGRVADVPRTEHAMDAVLMLTAAAARLGDRLGMTTFDRRIRSTVAPGTGVVQLTRVSEALYLLEPELVESDYRAVFATTLARVRRRALVCVLTELADGSLPETLLPVLPLLARTHLVLVGAVRDPELGRWSASVPEDVEQAYRKAAAARALESRRRLSALLRSLGAVVVDEGPGDLAPALTDAYLRAKFTGAL